MVVSSFSLILDFRFSSFLFEKERGDWEKWIFMRLFLSLIVHTRLLSIFMNEVSYCSRVVQLFSFASLISFIFFNDNKLNVELSFDVLVVVSFLFIYQLFPFLYFFFFLSRCLQFVNAFHAYFIELFFPYSLFTSFFISIVFFSLRFSFTFHLFCSFFLSSPTSVFQVHHIALMSWMAVGKLIIYWSLITEKFFILCAINRNM